MSPRDVVPEPYRRPVALNDRPNRVDAYHAWLEAVPLRTSRRSDEPVYRYEVRHAYVSLNPAGQLAWRVHVLAPDVDRLDGTLLVSGLRALRPGPGGDGGRPRWYQVGPLARRS